MVLRLGNDIIMPRGLHIRHVQGRNKASFLVEYEYLGGGVFQWRVNKL